MSEINPEAIKVIIETSRIVKPAYTGNPPATAHRVPLTVFDILNVESHVAVIFAFRSPAPSNSTIEKGLASVLSEYREWAGRLEEDAEGNHFILLSDDGVRFVEATVDSALDKVMPFKPSTTLPGLHPSLDTVEELLQVQLTRFACGSLVVGFTAHHYVADGHATSNFLVAWGLATRGLPVEPLPVHRPSTFFVPRNPPRVEFEHRGVEFATKQISAGDSPLKEGIVLHKVHFPKKFLTRLKSKASLGADKPYTTVESLVAHLWRVVTAARGLDKHKTTYVRISVDGRSRMSPCIPGEYFGNVVLRAYPRAKVNELVNRPLPYSAELIRSEVRKVNDRYFRSFIDFASSGMVEKEGLLPTENKEEWMLSPNMEVNSLLKFPFNEVDFGGGCPNYLRPAYWPLEGMLFLLPSLAGDGSIDAFVNLFHHNLPSFKHSIYSLD